MPTVDRRVVLHARITALPGTLTHPVEHIAGLPRRAGLRGIGHPAGRPGVVAIDRLHEVVSEADGEIGVLEEDRAVGLAVEVGVVAPLLDQHAGLVLLLRLALDELHHVGVCDFERLHLGGAPRLAAAFHDRGHLVVDAHEGKGAGGLAAAGELLALAAEGGEIRAGAGAELEEHRLAPRELHDVFHVVLHALDEAGTPLRILVGVVGHDDVALRLVPAPVAGGALDAVLVVEADVEPHRGIEGPVLVDAQPGEIAVEVLAILTRLEVAVGDPPVSDRPGDAVDELLDGVLALGGVNLAIKVLADDDVRRQLGPGGGDLAGRLLEEDLPVLPLDCGRPQIPFGGVKRRRHIGRAEGGRDGERLPSGWPRILTPQVVGRRRRSGVRTVGSGGSGGRLEGCHREAPWGKRERGA